MSEAVRLQRFLATAGVAARRKAETMIEDGRVRVNGEIVRVLGTKVDPTSDSVTVDGEAVVALDHFYVLLNKPKGCITAVSDDRGRPTVMDYLPNLPVPVKPVGRLDFYTEGVLLLTNDGELAAKLLAPASHVAKTYHAKVHGRVTPAQLTQLRAGITLEDGMVTQPAEVALLPSESKHSWVAVTLYEGKHHQVHRMFEALGFRVDKLQRVAFANLTFHHLRVGDARELTQQELNELRETVGLPRGPVARGRWRASREATDIPRRARAKLRAEAEADSVPVPVPAPAPERPRSTEPPRRERTAPSFGRRDRGGPRDDRGPRSKSQTDRGPRSGARDDRGPRSGPRDDRGSRSKPQTDRGPRSGPRDNRGQRSAPRADRGGSRPRGQGRSSGKRR
jgi:23S rRNA pseudouridine2605 synthase